MGTKESDSHLTYPEAEQRQQGSNCSEDVSALRPSQFCPRVCHVREALTQVRSGRDPHWLTKQKRQPQPNFPLNRGMESEGDRNC